MKFFILDETNTNWDRKLEFLVYGGIVVEDFELRSLSKKLIELKREAGIDLERPIKWTNQKWRGHKVIDSEIFKNLKEEVLNLISVSSVKVILYFAPHNFYHKPKNLNAIEDFKFRMITDKAKQCTAYKYALNVCARVFNSQMASESGYGMMVVDSFEESFNNDLRKHCFSLYCNGGDYSDLRRIVYPISESNEEYSHIHQINDIVLGTIQDSLKEMHENLIPKIKNVFYDSGKSINIYPRTAITQSLRESQEELRNKLKRLIE